MIEILNAVLSSLPLGLMWAITTVGVYITFRVLDVADLTVDGTLGLGAAVSAVLIMRGFDPFLSVLIAFFFCLFAGLCSALLHTKLKIPALLAGILTMTALYSIVLRVMGRANVSINNKETIFTTFRGFFKIPSRIEIFNDIFLSNVDVLIVGTLFVIIIAIILYYFFGTELGSAIRATGNNPQMIRAQGVNTDTTKIIGLMLSNGLVAISGSLLTQSQKFAEVTMGTGTIVIGLASVIIGEVLFGVRSFKNCLISIILGSLVYRMVISIVLELGMNPNDLKLLTASIIAVALALPLIKGGILQQKKRLVRKEGSADA
jgi:putative ABC transport system permease protein